MFILYVVSFIRSRCDKWESMSFKLMPKIILSCISQLQISIHLKITIKVISTINLNGVTQRKSDSAITMGNYASGCCGSNYRDSEFWRISYKIYKNKVFKCINVTNVYWTQSMSSYGFGVTWNNVKCRSDDCKLLQGCEKNILCTALSTKINNICHTW